ncbi:nucleoside hydrolase [Klebsiella quasipneumoniae]|uniref:nucleoside hydrolase n=1 Tax=Klebsiella quasipneumoniae TaxID=1463165 RepID=UPI002F9686F6
MALPIMIDCDPGHDDAIALVLALASPELKVKAVTASAGNQTPEKTLRNVRRMLTLLNRADIPVAGGAEKCRYAVDTLGFDVCLDHRAADFAEQLAQACPQGIDVYYENVGGKVFDAVLPLLNTAARVPVCGLVSGYNATGLPDGPDRLPLLMATILKKRIRMQGFIIGQDYGHRIAEFQQQMGRWVQEGKIKYREQLIDGLEQAPQALIGLLKGENFGKVVIRVSADD